VGQEEDRVVVEVEKNSNSRGNDHSEQNDREDHR
jgi:hypothetical protein